VLLDGVRREVVAIGIDTLDVDLDGASSVAIGELATVFGPGDDGEPTAEEWASWAETVGDELVVRASTRAERMLIGG
jgi:alanine racemase